MPTRDEIAILERAYDLSGSLLEWQRTLTEAVHHSAGLGAGWASFLSARSAPPHLDPTEPIFIDVRPAHRQLLLQALALMRDRWRELIPTTRCATVSQNFGGKTDAVARAMLALWAPYDNLGLVARNPDGSGLSLGTVLPRPTALSRPFVRHWTRVATHIAAGLRLRQSLGGADGTPACANATAGDGEAVLEISGRVAHANEPAQSATARKALRAAVRAIDRARGALRRQDSIAAVEMWQGLVAGRWSLVDRYESDGRRYYIAHRNTPCAPAVRALGTRESQVVAYAAQGHSNKLIAYELGLSTSTVGAYLSAARKKLGVASRTELVRLARVLRSS